MLGSSVALPDKRSINKELQPRLRGSGRAARGPDCGAVMKLESGARPSMPRKALVYDALIRCCESGVMDKHRQTRNAMEGWRPIRPSMPAGVGPDGSPGRDQEVVRTGINKREANRFKSSNGGDF